jgi:hypothetical protein
MPKRTFTKQVCLWLTEAELRRLDAQVKKAGISRRAYLRHLVNGAVPVDRPPPDYFAMTRELHSIGNNLNQIAAHAHSSGLVDEARYHRNVAKLDEAIAKIARAVELPRKIE